MINIIIYAIYFKGMGTVGFDPGSSTTPGGWATNGANAPAQDNGRVDAYIR